MGGGRGRGAARRARARRRADAPADGPRQTRRTRGRAVRDASGSSTHRAEPQVDAPTRLTHRRPADLARGPAIHDGSEARGRRSALRPGDQRRRRAARALHRRASRAARRGRGADDVRDRLRHVAQRAAARRRAGQRRAGAALPGEARARSAACSARRSDRVFEQPHSLGDELDWLDAEGPTSPALVDYIAQARGRLRLLPVLQLSLLPRVSTASRAAAAGRFSCRPPSATRRSACRSSSRCSAACARSCTTRRKSGR